VKVGVDFDVLVDEIEVPERPRGLRIGSRRLEDERLPADPAVTEVAGGVVHERNERPQQRVLTFGEREVSGQRPRCAAVNVQGAVVVVQLSPVAHDLEGEVAGSVMLAGDDRDALDPPVGVHRVLVHVVPALTEEKEAPRHRHAAPGTVGVKCPLHRCTHQQVDDLVPRDVQYKRGLSVIDVCVNPEVDLRRTSPVVAEHLVGAVSIEAADDPGNVRRGRVDQLPLPERRSNLGPTPPWLVRHDVDAQHVPGRVVAHHRHRREAAGLPGIVNRLAL
jgi:hypothetical protein